MTKKLYEAVNVQRLKAIFSNQCSPDLQNEKAWYVIGPDINKKTAHVATCPCELSAKQYADTLNKNFK